MRNQAAAVEQALRAAEKQLAELETAAPKVCLGVSYPWSNVQFCDLEIAG